jgi:hypothetical protein
VTPRDVALSNYNVLRAQSRAVVLGGDPEVVAAARVDVAERAERSVRAAVGTDRTRLTEPNDHQLALMLNYCRMRVEECRGATFAARGGPTGDSAG